MEPVQTEESAVHDAFANLTSSVEPGLRVNGMHACRHFYASVQLENGVSPVALAEHMGHSDPGYLMRVYGHRMPTADRSGPRCDGPMTTPQRPE